MTLLFILLAQFFPFASHPNIEHTNVSLMIQELGNGRVVDTFRAGQVTVPASVLKLFTTAAALETLGPQFRFPTFIEYSGHIRNDTLFGNLYIRGKCDPTLGAKPSNNVNLNTWVKKIKQAGIHYINGDIIADLTFLQGDAYNPAWLFEDAGNYYAPGIYAINYLSNTMNIILKSASEGSIADVVKTEPQYDSLLFINNIKCDNAHSHEGAYVHSMPYCNIRYLYGCIPSQKGQWSIKGDIPNPGLLLTRHLTDHLRQQGVLLKGKATYLVNTSQVDKQTSNTRTLIHTHYSDSLGTIIAETNKNSNNLYAEALFRYMGTLSDGDGTIRSSCAFLKNFWQRRGIELNEMVIKDGCGLAPQNAVSAQSVIKVLDYMAKSQYAQVWKSSLAVCGESGTLEPFLKNTPLQGITLAKSGTIASTRNMAGYIILPDNRTIAFAILINGTADKARKLQKYINDFLLHVYKTNT